MRTFRLIIILMSLCIVSPTFAIKKKKVKKGEVTVVTAPEPDAPANTFKATPDTAPNKRTQPVIGLLGAEGDHLHGIDVSHYQGRIDWRTVAKSKEVGYVYIKATESNYMVDDTYEYNLTEARRNGIKAGSYHFFRPGVSAAGQFALFKRVIDKRKQDLLPLIDVEVTGGVSIATLHSRLQEFLKLVTEEYGRRPVIYTGRNFYNKYFADYDFYKPYLFMIAMYNTAEQPYLDNGEDYVIWQYSSKGRIDGIRGDVDQSRFVGRHTLSEILYK
ncbi:MAG: glycosyl hydrolase family 25 [Bacteroidaceae bacterium]|nr:glycosyl hydrolase family 25 [Bacteroidaceae bacterium]